MKKDIEQSLPIFDFVGSITKATVSNSTGSYKIDSGLYMTQHC